MPGSQAGFSMCGARQLAGTCWSSRQQWQARQSLLAPSLPPLTNRLCLLPTSLLPPAPARRGPQVQQALVYEAAVAQWRRNKRDPAAVTYGVLYWQLNDIWQVRIFRLQAGLAAGGRQAGRRGWAGGQAGG